MSQAGSGAPRTLPRALLCWALLTAGCWMAGLARAGGISKYLATKTRYAHRISIPNAPSIYEVSDPPGYTAATVWVLARHGTRWPTPDRMQQINSLQETFKAAKNVKEYPWIQGWVSPIQGLDDAGGELHPLGEDELWSLAVRLGQRFPTILRSEYLPRRYPIVSTQVARTAASASAFAAGYFPFIEVHDHDKHDRHLKTLTSQIKGHTSQAEIRSDFPTHPVSPSMAQWRRRPQAVAVNMAPKNQDPLLRFFDMCPVYAQRETWLETWLSSWLASQWATVVPELEKKLGMTRPLGPCEVDALWQLCQFEAGLLGVEDRACSLFTEHQLSLFEWLDDINLHESHGWGSPVNYKIAAPLLQDLRNTLEAASLKHTSRHKPGSAPHARLLFAHCETLVPLAALLGLFEPELPDTTNTTVQPSMADLNKIIPADQALGLLHQTDSLSDLPLHTTQAAVGTAGSDPAAQQTTRLGEGIDVCTTQPGQGPLMPPPKGWTPRVPFNESRIFRGGKISPFGANMVVVLYRKKNSDGSHSHRVRLLWNEQVVPVPGCKPVGSHSQHDDAAHLDCDLEDFLRVTAHAAGDADSFQKACMGGASSAA